MTFDTQKIRGGTRIALPDDDGYLFRLGVAIYGFASISSFMAEIITHLDPRANLSDLHNMVAGRALDRFRSAVKNWQGPDISGPASRAADEFAHLKDERADFVHAYPITSPSGEQILHRRVDADGKYFEVTNELLDDFTSRLHIVSSALYEIRAIARPDL